MPKKMRKRNTFPFFCHGLHCKLHHCISLCKMCIEIHSLVPCNYSWWYTADATMNNLLSFKGLGQVMTPQQLVSQLISLTFRIYFEGISVSAWMNPEVKSSMSDATLILGSKHFRCYFSLLLGQGRDYQLKFRFLQCELVSPTNGLWFSFIPRMLEELRIANFGKKYCW